MGTIFNPSGMGGSSLGKITGSKFHRIVGVVGDRWCESIRLIYSTGTEGLVSQLPEALGLLFSSSKDLNKIIDKKLPNGLPQFIREEAKLAGQKYEFYHHDILQCVQVLYGDPELAECLVYTPEEHYTGPDKKSQIFSEMNSGRWWWTQQVGSHLNYSHLYHQSNHSSTERTRKRVSWDHNHPSNPLVRQNESCTLWDKDRCRT